MSERGARALFFVRSALLAACAAPLAGCGRDVAQTAEPGAPIAMPPSCGAAPLAVTLPRDATFGDGSEPSSGLVGSGYGAAQGPGLFVMARDGFRAYLNGQLVEQSSGVRAAEFVPLTLLPGDNVLALVVAAAGGTPLVLAQLDELERSYPSDSSWRVNSAPAGDFRAPGYDDSGWPSARDFGAAGALPGCSAAGVFPESSAARWIGPEPGSGAVVALRKTIRVAPLGYGEATSGGLGAEPALVETWDELVAAAEAPDAPATILLAEGVHDFRLQGAEVRAQQACPATCSNDPNKTTYRVLTEGAVCDVPLVDMTRNERTLRLGSNKTLVGLGRGASLRGVSLDFGESQNVIVRNLTIFDVNPQLIEAGDAFGLVKPSGVWIDHSTTRFISDGFSDSRAGSANITISWVHFAGASPASCSGNHQRGAQFSDSTLTLHHCFFDHVDSHSPLADHPQARVHVFNNLLRDNPDYGVGAACGAEVLMEGNILEAVRYPTLRTTCPDDSQLGLILAPEGSNLYRADVGTEHRGGDGGEPRDAVSQPPYAYTVEAPEEAWLHVLSRAGAGGPWAVPVTLD